MEELKNIENYIAEITIIYITVKRALEFLTGPGTKKEKALKILGWLKKK